MNYLHGYPLDVKREFWNATGRIRNAMDQSLTFHEAQARAMEQAAELVAEKMDVLWIDRQCDPWFVGTTATDALPISKEKS